MEATSKSIVFAGYSSTGLGHTDRLLNVLRAATPVFAKKALAEGVKLNAMLKAGDTIILLLPPPWKGDSAKFFNAIKSNVSSFIHDMTTEGIAVVLLRGQKSAQGMYDGPNTDAVATLEQMAAAPLIKEEKPAIDFGKLLSQKAGATMTLKVGADKEQQEHIAETSKMLSDYPREAYEAITATSANNLLDHFVSYYETHKLAAHYTVHCVTDMDYALSSAFRKKVIKQGGIKANLVEQDNHSNVIAKALETSTNAAVSVWAKVLSPESPNRSKISWGDLNPMFGDWELYAQQTFGFATNKNRQEGTLAIIKFLKENAKYIKGHVDNIYFDANSSQDNLVVIYAGTVDRNRAIMNHISTTKVGKRNLYLVATSLPWDEEVIGHAATQKSLGMDAAKDLKAIKINALRWGLLAGADLIAQGGMGVFTEHLYRVKKCDDAKSRMFCWPMTTQREQELNAEIMNSKYGVESVKSSSTPFQAIDAFLTANQHIADKVALREKQNYEKFAEGLKSPETDALATAKLLWQEAPELSEAALESWITQAKDAKTKANYRFLKLIFQICPQFQRSGTTATVQVLAKLPPTNFPDYQTAVKAISDATSLMKLIGMDPSEHVKPTDIEHLDPLLQCLTECQKMDKEKAKEHLRDFEVSVADRVLTGF